MVAACLVMLSFLDQRATSGIEGPIVIDSPVPVLSPLITLIALTASWLWPNPTLHSSSEPSMDSSSGSLERLAQHDYYIELACSRFLGATCSGISKILLALEAVLAQWLSTAAWETRLRFVASEADEMDEESIPQTWVMLTWVTVIVLASGLIVGRILFV